MKVYDKKIIVSGNIVEVYSYAETQYKRQLREPKVQNHINGQRDVSEDELEEYSKKNGYKRKRDLRRLINANADDLQKFFTLTFKENITDINIAYDELKKFKMRLKYYLKKEHQGRELKYVVVVEFQKRGAVHFHMLCNLPYIPAKKLAELWGNGYIKINKIETVDNVGSYVVKYMGKDFKDDRLKGRKRYNRSRNLVEPKEITEKEKVTELVAQLPVDKKVFEKTFDNEFVGSVHYQQFNLNR